MGVVRYYRKERSPRCLREGFMEEMVPELSLKRSEAYQQMEIWEEFIVEWIGQWPSG